MEIGSKPNSCQYDLDNCTKPVQDSVGYDPSTGIADPAKATGGSSGTASTDSSGNTSNEPYYACSGTGPAEIYRPIDGPEDLSTNSGNYLSSLLSNGDFWSGLIETIGGAFTEAGGGALIVTGIVECGVGVLCAAGVPSVAGGTGLVVVGSGFIQSGSDKLGKAFREADGASGGGDPSTGQVGYGSTQLGRSVALQRLLDRKKTGGNYAAGRLEDGTVIVGRSSGNAHAEEDVIRQANGKRIVDMYSEREPCKNKCQGLTSDMNVTYTVRWNGVDRDAANAELKKAMRDFFNSI